MSKTKGIDIPQPSTNFFVLSGFEEFYNQLTGNRIVQNTNYSEFLIPPTWNPLSAAKAKDAWNEYYEANKEFRRPRNALKEQISQISVGSPEEFAGCCEKIVRDLWNTRKYHAGGDNQVSYIGMLLRLLWAVDCLCWPTRHWTGVNHVVNKPSDSGWLEKGQLIQEVADVLSWKTVRGYYQDFRYVLLSCVGIQTSLDICPDIFRKNLFRKGVHFRRIVSIFANYISSKYQLSPPLTAEDFRIHDPSKRISRQDPEFKWAELQNTEIVQWTKFAREFSTSKPGYFGHATYVLNFLLDKLLEEFEILPTVEDFVKNSADKVAEWISSHQCMERTKVLLQNTLHSFFEYVLDFISTDRQLTRNELSKKGLRNPVYRAPDLYGNRIETHRARMPHRLVQEALEILTENTVRDKFGELRMGADGSPVTEDFAWPKSRGNRITANGDWFQRYDPTTGTSKILWSPVRTCILILKLLLPARSFQIRFQESDESDTEIFRDGSWVANNHPFAPKAKGKPVSRGALRKYLREDGSFGTHIYFNTNKSEYASVDPNDRGYVMPWEHKQAIEIYEYLNVWQRENNPLREPTKWEAVRELSERLNRKVLKELGTANFLFRDPTSPIGEPVRDSSIRSLWRLLQLELQSRLAKRGEVHIDGSAITLVHIGIPGIRSGRLAYDLHSLRVSRVSMMYEAGVPPEVIQRVVGHRYILYTYYYTKISPERVQKVLDEAQQKLILEAQTNWLEFVGTHVKSSFPVTVVANDYSQASTIDRNGKENIVRLRDGLCLAGMAKCHIGLDSVDEVTGKKIRSQVPGGAANCQRCRYFVTGLPFIDGVVFRVNQKASALRDASRNYELSQNRNEGVRAKLQRKVALGGSLTSDEAATLQNTSAQFLACQNQVEEEAANFSSAYHLLRRLRELSASIDENDNLVLLGPLGGKSFDMSLEESSVVTNLQYLCERAEMYSIPQTEWNTHNLLRMRLFDRVARSAGVETFFSLDLSDEECLTIGNQFGRLLISKLGDASVENLASGKASIEELSILKELVEQMPIGGKTPVKTIETRTQE